MARILLIEDNAANMELMSYLLRAFGHAVLEATDGRVGIRLAADARPDLVICDLQLPIADGYEVARTLKADPALRSTPLVAVTAYAMVDDRQKAPAAGFDGYVSKPIEPEKFVSQLEPYLCERSGALPGASTPASAPAAADPGAARAHILVVDDTQANRELIACLLQPFRYEVLQSSNVAAALASARACSPDLIMSDIHMPGEDGFDLLRQLRGDSKLRGIPFMFTSATDWSNSERDRAYALGADFFILTPTEPEPLLEAVRKLLGAARR
jgi:two-component system cell cycle response regulator